MNERIRELAEQAEQYTNDTVAHLERVHNRDFSFDEIDEVYNTKFSELIIKECLSYAKDGDLDFMKFMIKKNFGVEE